MQVFYAELKAEFKRVLIELTFKEEKAEHCPHYLGCRSKLNN